MFTATSASISLSLLHTDIVILEILILLISLYILLTSLIYFTIQNKLIYTYARHDILKHIIEIIWTIIPLLIICTISIPSFQLLYETELYNNPELYIKIVANQWFWNIELSNFLAFPLYTKLVPSILSYKSIHRPNTHIHLVKCSNVLILPTNTQIHFSISSNDVLHSMSLHIMCTKIDAIPGRINKLFLHVHLQGQTFGMCSELCGILHSFMPISCRFISIHQWFHTLKFFDNF